MLGDAAERLKDLQQQLVWQDPEAVVGFRLAIGEEEHALGQGKRCWDIFLSR